MKPLARRGVAVVLLTWAALGLVIIPSFAASTSFQVETSKHVIKEGGSLSIIGIIKHGSPNCDYSVTYGVAGPGGHWTVSSSIITGPKGSGFGVVNFPSDFGGSTDAAGTYAAAAKFSCGYSVGTAVETFVVIGHGPGSGVKAD